MFLTFRDRTGAVLVQLRRILARWKEEVKVVNVRLVAKGTEQNSVSAADGTRKPCSKKLLHTGVECVSGVAIKLIKEIVFPV